MIYFHKNIWFLCLLLLSHSVIVNVIQSGSSHLFYWGLLGIPKMTGSVVNSDTYYSVTQCVWFSHDDDGVTIYVTIWWRALKAVLARDKTHLFYKKWSLKLACFATSRTVRPDGNHPRDCARRKLMRSLGVCQWLPNTGYAEPWNRQLHLVPTPF